MDLLGENVSELIHATASVSDVPWYRLAILAGSRLGSGSPDILKRLRFQIEVYQ